jgi:Amt family ammonium transporter
VCSSDLNTQVATGVGALAWLVAEWARIGKPTTLGAASGALAGLVAITPAAGFVSPLAACLIGLVAGVLCYGGVVVKGRIGYDDSLDVVGVHGLGGLWGALATGLFASKAWNPDGADGLFYGNPAQLGIQALGVAGALVYSLIVTLVILKIVQAIWGLRLSDEEELQGLDMAQHSETGYSLS